MLSDCRKEFSWCSKNRKIRNEDIGADGAKFLALRLPSRESSGMYFYTFNPSEELYFACEVIPNMLVLYQATVITNIF